MSFNWKQWLPRFGSGATPKARPIRRKPDTSFRPKLEPLEERILPAVELQVIDLTAPASAALGDTISVSWTVTNQGDQVATADWRDRIFIDSDGLPGGNELRIFSESITSQTPLAPGASYTVTRNITIPSSAATGSEFLLVKADENSRQAESDETNNSLAVPITITPSGPAPDLEVTEATAPSSAFLGDTVSVSWTVANQGNDTASGFWFDNVYISDDALVDGSDRVISTFSAGDQAPLAVGSSYSVTQDMQIPFDRSGRFLLVVTDAGHDQGSLLEVSDTNNVLALPIVVNAPDLRVSAATAPSTGVVSGTLPVSWTVVNDGSFPATRFWSDTVYLSTDQVLDSNDTSVANFDASDQNPLAAGGSYSRDRNVTLPNVPTGDYYVLIQTDAPQNQGETDETNNVLSAGLITLRAADLSVTAASAPATAVVGADIDVSWTVSNLSADVPTGRGPWFDAIYVSDNATLDFQDVGLDNKFVGDPLPLAPGASYTLGRTVTLFGHIVTPGNKYLLFVADVFDQQGETDNTNNVRAVPITLFAPDLVVSAASAPASADAGATINVSWTVTNQGDVPAPADWLDAVAISNHPTLDTAARFLLFEPITDPTPLAAGASYTVSRDITIPGNLSQGSYYLFFVADRRREQAETNENNNVLALPIALGTPDLRVTSASAPASVIVGGSAQISWTVTNQSSVVPAVSDWADFIYISDNQLLSTDDTFVSSESISDQTPLAPGASYSITKTVTIPNTATGNRFLLFVADGSHFQGESDETNNVLALPIALGAPDLVVSAATAPDSAVLGETIPVSWTVTNQGNLEAPADWYDAVYISDDEILDGSDTEVATELIQGQTPLAPGASYTISRNVVIPSTATGSRSLLFVADAFDSQGEADQTNNVRALPVLLTAPDLRVSSITSPAESVFGDTIDISWTVVNQGSGVTAAVWQDRVLLSRDTVLGDDSILLDLAAPSDGLPLAPGSSYTRNVSVRLPLDASLSEGTYFLFVLTDFLNQQPEVSESNNRGVSGPMALTLPRLPDLVVSDITAPAEAFSNQSVQVSWVLTNQGTADASGTWTDDVFLSPDNQAGGDAKLGSFAFTGTIAPGQSVTRTQTVFIPFELSGQRFFIVQTDAEDTIFEHAQEGNNVTVDNAPIDIHVSPFPNLVVENVAHDLNEVELGQQFAVDWVVRNTGAGATSASFWKDFVYLSVDTTLDPTDVLVGSASNATYLNAGEAYASSAVATAQGVSEGDYFVLVMTDADGNRVNEFTAEHDNVGVGPQIHVSLPPPPDLIVVSVQAPEQAFSGQLMSLTYNVLNAGTGPVTTSRWFDDVYMSADDQLDANDQRVARLERLLSNSRNASGQVDYTATQSVRLPVGVGGQFFFFVHSDATNTVNEFAFDLNNANFDSVPTTVNLTPPPDLEVDFLDAPASAVAGRAMTFRYSVTNAGATRTPNTDWTDSFYLSADNQLDIGSDVFLADRHISFPSSSFDGTPGGLDVDETYSRAVTLTIPNGLQGPFFLFAAADRLNDVFELDNANNIKAGPVAVQVNLVPPDLHVAEMSADTTAEAGGALHAHWSVSNQGVGDTITGTWTDRLFLSTNGVVGDADDRELGSFTHFGLLHPNESYSLSVTVALPFDMSGPANLYVRTDAGDHVAEFAGEGNNVSTLVPITVTRHTADFQITPTLLTPENGGLRIEWTVANIGAGKPNNGFWTDGVFLSANDQFGDGDDVRLGSVYISRALDPGAQYQVSERFKVPFNLNGPFRVFVKTDVDRKIDEDGSEANNTASAGVIDTTQLRTRPDLVLTQIEAPSEATSGQDFDVTWTVRNQGDPMRTQAPLPPEYETGRWQDTVYLSRDQIFDPGSDIFLGQVTRSIGNLTEATEGGVTFQTYGVTRSLRMPAGLTGPFYVFVAVDRGNQVVELGGEGNNVRYDTGAMFASLAPPADLVVGSVTVPENASIGAGFSLSYTLQNQGTSTAAGSWYDRLYLSRDAAFSLDDVSLGTRLHSSSDPNLPLGGSITLDFGGALPGVTPGDYFIVLRTDAFNQVPESDETNNLGASLASFTIDVPELVLTGGVASTEVHTFLANQQTRSFFFRFDVAAGQTIALDASGIAIPPVFVADEFGGHYEDVPRQTVTAAYVALARVPTPFAFDFGEDRLLTSSVNNFTQQRLIIPRTEAGTYFIRLDVRDTHPNSFNTTNPEGSEEDFQFMVSVLPFTVAAVTPNRAGNTGLATFEVVASDFTPCSIVQLLQDGQVVRTPQEVRLVDRTRAFVTFDLTGLAPGQYELRVADGGGSDTEPLEIVQGIGANVGATIRGPSPLRRGGDYLFYVNYGNEGDADGVPPLLLVENLATNPFALSLDELPTGEVAPGQIIQVLGIGQDGAAGVLRPGQLGSVPFFFHTGTFDAGQFRLHTITADDSRPLNFADIEAQVRPEGLDDATWNAVRPQLIARLGPTWGSYVRALAQVATELADIGLRTPDVRLLFRELARQAAEPSPLAVTGYVVSGEDCGPVADARVRAVDALGREFAGVAGEAGRFFIADLAPGNYTIVADAPGLARSRQFDVAVGLSPTSLNIEMAPEAVIQGSVALAAGGPTDGTLLVSARLHGQSADPSARFSFQSNGLDFRLGGLPAGTYDVRIVRGDYLPYAVSVTLADQQTLDLGEINLIPAATVSGVVTSHIADFDAGQAVIGVFATGVMVNSATADATGAFQVEALGPGDYTLRVINLTAGASTEASVTVGQGAHLSGIALTVLPGASLLGTVTDPTTSMPLANVQVFAYTPDGGAHSALTDENGLYRIDHVGLGRHLVALATASAAEAVAVEVTGIDGDEYTADLSFAPAARITGLVTDAAAIPLVGVAVRLFRDGEFIITNRSDTSGRYTLLLSQAGSYDISAAYDGASFATLAGVTVSPGQTLQQNIVSGDGSLVVTLGDASQGVTGAVVFLHRLSGDERILAGSATAGSAGSVQFGNLVAGPYVVEVVGANSRGGSASITLTGGTQTLAVTLEQQFPVSGALSDSDGNPVRGALVLLASTTDRSKQLVVVSGPDGQYQFSAVAGGTYDLLAIADGFQTLVREAISITAPSELDGVLNPSTSQLTGRITDAAGHAVPGGLVQVLDSQGRLLDQVAVQTDGTFRARGAAGDNLTVVLQVIGFAPARLTGIAVSDGGATALGDVVLQAVAIGQGFATQPVPQTAPLTSALTAVGSSTFAVAPALPAWLGGNFFGNLFGEFNRNRADEVQVDDIPDLPKGCTECGPYLHRAVVFQSFQGIRADIAEQYDQDLASQKVIVAGLFVSELAVAAGAMASLVITAAELFALSSYAAVSTAVAAEAGAGAGVGVATGTSAAAGTSVLVIIQKSLELLVSVGKIKDAITQAFTSADSGTAEAALTQVNNAIQESNSIVGSLQTLLPAAISAAGTAVDVAGKLAGTIGAIQTIIDSFSMKATSDAVELYNDIKENLESAKEDYYKSITKAREKLAIYKACIQDADGDGHCDGFNHPNDPNNPNPNPNPPGPPNPNAPTPPFPPAPADPYNPQLILSSDPNDISGPEGFGPEGWIPLGDPLPYTIHFENEPTASAPAQRVVVTQQLDSDLDFRTFRVGDFGWGDVHVHLDGRQSFFQGRVDLPDELGFDVDVTATVDIVTGLVTWVLQTVDPLTGEAPTDPLAGFLPPDDENGTGEGFVSYTIRPRRNPPTGTVIDARATIVFDVNEPIDTPAVFNTLDTGRPTSQVTPLPDTIDSPDHSFLVEWAGRDDDNGSALADFTIYVSDNGGPFAPWLEKTTLSEATYVGQPGHTYAFYSTARDNAGNVESPPALPDAQATIPGAVRGAIRGLLFHDLNADGVQTADELGLAGRTVFLDLDQNGEPGANEPSTLTGPDGSYLFPDVAVGTYTLAQVLPDGWRQSQPGAPDFHYTVSVVGGDVAVSDFGNYQPATIRGLKFHDRDGDGVRDVDEPGLPGWTIFVDQNQNGALDPGELSTTTAPDGTYVFSGLVPGTYFLAEVPQEGWVQTCPGAGVQSSTAGFVTDAYSAGPTLSSNHFFPDTGDGRHFAWLDHNPATPSVVDIFYDFRAFAGYPNEITAEQMALAEQALRTWEAASDGTIHFVRDQAAPAQDIINIGVGALAALGATSSPRGVLALGGGTYVRNGQYVITTGIVWLDRAESWETNYANGNIPGTFDFFTVVAHEVGHALGLGHMDDLAGRDLMDGYYDGEKTTFSANDSLYVQAIYTSGGTGGGGTGASGTAALLPGTYAVSLSSGELLDQLNFGNRNLPATVTPPSTQTGLEGSGANFDLGSFTDPGAGNNPWAVQVDWGDGSSPTQFDTSTPGALPAQPHTYADDGTYHATVQVTDQWGNISTAPFDVVVDNRPPVVTPPANQTADEGALNLFNLGNFSDFGQNDSPWTVDVDWGDGSVHTMFTAGAQGVLTAQPHAFANGTQTYTVVVQISNKDEGIGSASFQVTVANLPPSATITGAPVSGHSPEGTAITLGSSVTDPSSVDTTAGFTYSWTVTKNGSAFASGTSAGLSFTPDDNGTYVVTLTAKDKDNGVSAPATTTIIVDDVVPTAAIAGPPSGVRGQPRAFTVSATDPSVVDQAAGFTFAISWGDGTTQTVTGLSGSAVSHIYTDAGTYTIRLTATDKDGGTSAAVTQSITIAAVAIQTDPFDAGRTALVVGGTTGTDTILLKPNDTRGTVNVKVNGVVLDNFLTTGHIFIYGQAGDDTIKLQTNTVNGQTVYVAQPAFLFGDDGNDTLNVLASTANNVLVGGAGNDFLQGGSGRDLLIGGPGSDTLHGDSGDDLLIGGTTDFDANLSALNAAMTEWGRTDASYQTRVKHLIGTLSGGLNDSVFLTAYTVHDDGAIDLLFGETGMDWFFAHLAGANADKVKDQQTGEVITSI